MSGHVAEARVSVADATRLARQVCIRIAIVCQQIRFTEKEIWLGFDGGVAVIRPIGDTLLFRVEALDLPTFRGIQTLLEGSLSEIVRVFDYAFDWQRTDPRPSSEMRPKDRG